MTQGAIAHRHITTVKKLPTVTHPPDRDGDLFGPIGVVVATCHQKLTIYLGRQSKNQ
jgi:hypothetical protein